MVETRKKFKRRKFYFNGPGHTLCGDVAYLNDFAQNGFKYLLFLMDCFSRYIFIFPLKRIRQNDVVPCIKSVISESVYKFSHFMTDRGSEFFNKGVQKLMEKYKIKHYSTKSEMKCSIIERCIKTLKRKFAKFIIEHNDNLFLKNLHDIIASYNSSPHVGLLGESPLNIYTLHDRDKINKLKMGTNEEK